MLQEANLRLRAYMGGLAHVHTRLSNHPTHHESDLTPESLMQELIQAGLCGRPGAPIHYIMFNEHSANPNRPRRLGRLSWRTQLLLRQRKLNQLASVPVIAGLEASLLPDDGLDLSTRLDHQSAVIIASRHRLPQATEHQPAAIMTMFRSACANPEVDILGHPARNIEAVRAVNWAQVFEWAADSGTAVEVNINQFLLEEATSGGEFWRQWLAELGASKVDVFLGSDLHNRRQVTEFIRLWLEVEAGGQNGLDDLLGLLMASHIGPERVINATWDRLRQWLSLSKGERRRQ